MSTRSTTATSASLCLMLTFASCALDTRGRDDGGFRDDAGNWYDAGPGISCTTYCASWAACDRSNCEVECEMSRSRVRSDCQHLYESWLRCQAESEPAHCDGGRPYPYCYTTFCAMQTCEFRLTQRFTCTRNVCTLEDGNPVFCD